MAPTICSGKKRQTRTIATTNIRRHEEGSHQINQTVSNIINYVAKGSMNNRVTASLRIQTHSQSARNDNTTDNYRSTNNDASLNYNHSMQRNATSASTSSNHRHQLFSFISDNAVTSSTHSDTENHYDLRLANEVFTNHSTATYDSNSVNTLDSKSQSSSSLSESTTSSSSYRETMSSSTSSCVEERRFPKYSSVVQANNNLAVQDECSNDIDVTNLYKDDNDKVSNTNKETNPIHSSSMRKHYYACKEFDSEEEYDELEDEKELNSDMSGGERSDTDMDTDEADSMTSLDTEKSAKLKKGNHPLLRDKLLAEQQTDNSSNNNTKSVGNIRNTDGLLSIAIKTIKLVKRNQLLQQRLTQLQLETSEFIQSVLANPENRHFRENIKQKVQEVDNV